MTEIKNRYTVHVKKVTEGKVEILASTSSEAEDVVDCMDDDDIEWGEQQWPVLRAELEQVGKPSLNVTMPEVIAFFNRAVEPQNPMLLPEPAVSRIKEFLPRFKAAWESFKGNASAKGLLSDQEEMKGIFRR